MLPFIPPKRLVFSGGGTRVIAYLGAIQVLEEKGLLKHVKEFCGVSAGGLTALMLALGYSIKVLERFSFEYDFSELRSLEPEAMFEITETFGLDTGENVQKLIHKILKHKGFSADITFQQMAESGRAKAVRFWAADIQNLQPVEFSAKATPGIQVAFGLQASMTIPLYFRPLIHPDTKSYLVDGGVFDNYPLTFLTEDEIQETIGFAFEFGSLPLKVTDIQSFMASITCGYYKPSYQKFLNVYKHRTIVVPCGEYSSFDFEISVESRQKLASLGRQAAEDFFKRPKGFQLKRRNSVW
jgi:predicted acylesterase/phospholipase RssA